MIGLCWASTQTDDGAKKNLGRKENSFVPKPNLCNSKTLCFLKTKI
jgi:hypothetical protein